MLLNIGPRTRPAGPPAAARSRLLGVGSPPRTRADELTPLIQATPTENNRIRYKVMLNQSSV